MKIPTVIAPDVVGELVHIARDQAKKLGLDLAGQNLDGPPITSATWPGHFYITSQTPTAGSPLYRGDLIHVTFISDGDNHDCMPAQPIDPKASLSAHAEVDKPPTLL